MHKKIDWVCEDEAARMMKRHPRYLRAKAKKGEWDISYRTLGGRSYEYDRKGIEAVKNKEAKLIYQ